MKTKPTPRVKYALIAVVVIAFMLVLHFVLVRRNTRDAAEDAAKPNPVTVDVSQVTIQPIETIVTAQGTLAASQGASARIATVSAGRLVSVRVREGDSVSAGEVVAMLDNQVQRAQAESASSALRASEIQAQQAELSAKASATDYSNAVQVARLDFEVAKVELRKLESGARPQEITQAEQSVAQAKATRDRAATELDRVKFLYDKGIDSKRQLDDAQTALSVANSTLASARAQASLTRAGARPEDLQTARLRVQSARAALQKAEQGALQVQSKQRETQAAVESIRQKRADLAAARTTAGYAELRTPINGIVTRRSLNPGDMADTTTPVVEVTDTHALNLVASIPAEDGTAVRSGMQARVVMENAGDRVFTGKVLDVGQVDPQSGMLSVRIAVSNPGSVLKVGSFATADIVVHAEPSAVVVPKSAVITRNGKTVVFVVNGDTAHLKNVVTGVTQGDLIQISQGDIGVGDRVITQGQYELSDGSKVRVVR